MSTVKVLTNFNIDLDFEVPEFHRRLFAWAIDLFIQVFYILIASRIFNSFRDNSSALDNEYNSWGIGMMIILPFFIYHVVLEITMNGQSIGKKLLGIRVVNENGGKASISQFMIRWLIRTSDYTLLLIIIYAPLYGAYLLWALLGSILLLLADIILVVTSKKSQRLGDVLAHTILIRTKTRGSIEDTVFLEVADSYVPSFPQIMQLSDKDINAIKNILDTARKKGDFQLAEMAAGKIKNHLKIETTMPSFDFLDTLLKDYNYLSVK
ncbi:MAG: RDD family protein [Bacteroidetes bacterium]|nr:RDD family protein [Bacteroidota bacterium]